MKKLIGFMPDYFAVYEGMRVEEYLDFFGAAMKISVRRRRGLIADILALTDLTGKRDDYVETLSRGVRQRLCLERGQGTPDNTYWLCLALLAVLTVGMLWFAVRFYRRRYMTDTGRT